MNRSVRVASAILPLLLAACGGTATSKGAAQSSPTSRPSSPAKVKIVQPTNGEVVKGSRVQVKLSLEHARIVVPTTAAVDPTKGHIHLYLDGRIVSMNYKLEDTLGHVKPGPHTLKAEFVASDHLPFDPPVFDTVAFEDRR